MSPELCGRIAQCNTHNIIFFLIQSYALANRIMSLNLIKFVHNFFYMYLIFSNFFYNGGYLELKKIKM